MKPTGVTTEVGKEAADASLRLPCFASANLLLRLLLHRLLDLAEFLHQLPRLVAPLFERLLDRVVLSLEFHRLGSETPSVNRLAVAVRLALRPPHRGRLRGIEEVDAVLLLAPVAVPLEARPLPVQLRQFAAEVLEVVSVLRDGVTQTHRGLPGCLRLVSALPPSDAADHSLQFTQAGLFAEPHPVDPAGQSEQPPLAAGVHPADEGSPAA